MIELLGDVDVLASRMSLPYTPELHGSHQEHLPRNVSAKTSLNTTRTPSTRTGGRDEAIDVIPDTASSVQQHIAASGVVGRTAGLAQPTQGSLSEMEDAQSESMYCRFLVSSHIESLSS